MGKKHRQHLIYPTSGWNSNHFSADDGVKRSVSAGVGLGLMLDEETPSAPGSPTGGKGSFASKTARSVHG